MNKKKRKVLIALSGGIDSAVSAYLLLKQGYEVEAVFMKNWSSIKGLLRNECPWLEDRQDALRVAAFLRIPLHMLDFEQEYQDTVMNYFFTEYQAGRTPNPDVMCNKEIKFKLLYVWAMDNGFEYMATGHYAQIVPNKKSKHAKPEPGPGRDAMEFDAYTLARSADEFKDQTYFIYNIKPEQLEHILFPIGGMKKSEVKKLAKKIGLPNDGKKESMGICFVGKIRLKDFLEQKLKPVPGPIVGQDGKQIGEHRGLHNYTLGQRQGIHVGGNGPYYVFKKDLSTNTLYVTNNANDEKLETREAQIHSINWISHQISQLANKQISLHGRYRHQGELVPLTIRRLDNNHFDVIFKKPQKAVASGQSLVLYNKTTCIGGGIIV